MPDDTGGQGPSPADEFDRELRELTAGAAPAPLFQEPSAAERAKAGAAQARKAGKANAKQERKHGRRGQWTGSLVLVVILAVVAGLVWLRFGRFGNGYQRAGAEPAPSAGSASSAAPSPAGTVSPVRLSGGPPADPFTGTPADGWADGPAGIVPPPARPVGGFTAAQVAAAYATTRKLLIAAALDPKTLRGGAPAAFESLLFSQQRRDFLAGLNKTGLDKDGSPHSTRYWVFSFAPGSTALIGSVIKVHGTMSARASTYSGYKVVEVDVSYRFVYPVEPPGAPADWMRVVGAIYGPIYFSDFTRTGTSLQPWVHYFTDRAGGRCDVTDGYLHPDFANGPPDNAAESGPVINPYSTATAVPGATRCGLTTGT